MALPEAVPGAVSVPTVNDASNAGKDLASEGDKVLNFLIETALQAVAECIVAAV